MIIIVTPRVETVTRVFTAIVLSFARRFDFVESDVKVTEKRHHACSRTHKRLVRSKPYQAALPQPLGEISNWPIVCPLGALQHFERCGCCGVPDIAQAFNSGLMRYSKCVVFRVSEVYQPRYRSLSR